MKALEILKKPDLIHDKINYRTREPYLNYIYNKNKIDEAIVEIESLQNRSCNNCKHWKLGWCFKLGSSLDIGGCGDYWEQK